MPTPYCERCSDVRAALTFGDWTAVLLEHALTCEVCSEQCLPGILASVAGARSYQLPVPDPNVVWWKAELIVAERRARAARRPHFFAQMFAATILLLIFLVLATD